MDNDLDGDLDEDFADTDGDGIVDCMDACPLDPDNDIDGDGICGDLDNCVNTPNTDQADSDGDGIGDACDACPTIPDPACATCDNGKYLVCHLPLGNPTNYQQLCLPYTGATAHVGNHGGCYWGTCTSSMMVNPNNEANLTISGTKRDAGKLSQDIVPNYFDGNGSPLLKSAEFASYYFEVTPNPASDAVSIHLHGQEAGAQLQIHDQFGRLLLNRAVDEKESQFSLNLTDGRFVSGLYYVTIFTNGKTITQRLIVAK